MVNTADDIKAILKRHRRQINAFGVNRIRLFGSFARGEQKENSDVDLLASFVSEIHFEKLLRFQKYLSDLMGRPVEIVDEKTISEKFKKNVDMNRNKPLSEILEDMLLQVQKIETVKKKRAYYEADGPEYYYDLIVKSLENIGEACTRIKKHYPVFFEKYEGDLQLQKLIEQRNQLSHGYDTVNRSLVDQNIRDNIATLKQGLATALHREKAKEKE